jgi:hypothetical protein
MHSYLFSHVRRSGNIVAHMLARGAQLYSIPNVRMGTAPSELESLLYIAGFIPLIKTLIFLSRKKKKKIHG